jgi:hypothetical protein
MHKLNELKIWHKAIDLATEVYKATIHFPKEETYGMNVDVANSLLGCLDDLQKMNYKLQQSLLYIK